VTAVAAIPRLPLATAALVLAEVTGRVSVVIATSSPAARPGGFGALVADRTTAAERALTASALACAVAAAGLTAGGPALAVRGLAATLAGLLAGWLLQRTARRRLGGTTGDVFGAILQVSATTALVVAALVS
jgi:adenosylcobinamide-GDP ribazoletransferase